jgi:hypothetical protein
VEGKWDEYQVTDIRMMIRMFSDLKEELKEDIQKQQPSNSAKGWTTGTT